jgi:hypothetical protein
MNPDEQLRLECLRLAMADRMGDPIVEADRLFRFIKDGMTVSPSPLREAA